MGNAASNFHDHKKLDLFKIYFCHDECGTSITLKILDGYHHHQVSSIVYTIEFITDDRVLEVLTLSVKYINDDPLMMLNIEKNLLKNEDGDEENWQMGLGGNRIPIESRDVFLRDNTFIEIKEVTLNKYIISAFEKEKEGYGSFNHHKILGILEFKNATSKDHVMISPLIKCDIKIMEDDIINEDMKFKLSGPVLDNHPMEIKYYSSRYIHKKNKKYFIKNIPLLEVKDNIINSWTVYPKIQIHFKEYFDNNFFIYYFDTHYEVY